MTATVTTTGRLGCESGGRFGVEGGAARRRWALFPLVVGPLLVASSLAIALATQRTPTTQASDTITAPVGGPVAPFPSIGTSSVSYAPGHSSGWHLHPGVHSVVVLSGTLTVYDEHCVRTDYGPGETYLGGNAPHLAQNERAEDLNVAMTYVYNSTSEDSTTPLPAPADCDNR